MKQNADDLKSTFRASPAKEITKEDFNSLKHC